MIPTIARRLAVLALCAAAACGGAARAADDQEPAAPETRLDARRAQAALDALDERARLLDRLVAEAARAYRRAAADRLAAQQELSDALDRLDRDAARPRELSREALEKTADDVARARARLQQLLDDSGKKLDELLRLLAEQEAVARRVAELRGRAPEQAEPLTGAWDVVWLPGGQTGTFYLDQSGTLVTGQYKLGALGSGSVQGTFVAGKLHLERIDAQRGRDAELDATLDPDGQRLRGAWQYYEMVQGGVPRGQWTARRVH